MNIHELNHLVHITGEDDDGLPDFLVNDIVDLHVTPDRVYSSDGTVSSNLTVVTEATITGTLPVVTLTIPGTWNSDFFYLQINDTISRDWVLKSVERPDSSQVELKYNVWRTHKILRIVGKPEEDISLFHLFDVKGVNEYILTFEPSLEAPQNLKVIETGPTFVSLDWDSVSEAEYYMIQSKKSSEDEFRIVENLARFTNFNVTGLIPSTSYIFRVTAGNALNGYSSFSSNVTGITMGIFRLLINEKNVLVIVQRSQV